MQGTPAGRVRAAWLAVNLVTGAVVGVLAFGARAQKPGPAAPGAESETASLARSEEALRTAWKPAADDLKAAKQPDYAGLARDRVAAKARGTLTLTTTAPLAPTTPTYPVSTTVTPKYAWGTLERVQGTRDYFDIGRSDKIRARGFANGTMSRGPIANTATRDSACANGEFGLEIWLQGTCYRPASLRANGHEKLNQVQTSTTSAYLSTSYARYASSYLELAGFRIAEINSFSYADAGTGVEEIPPLAPGLPSLFKPIWWELCNDEFPVNVLGVNGMVGFAVAAWANCHTEVLRPDPTWCDVKTNTWIGMGVRGSGWVSVGIPGIAELGVGCRVWLLDGREEIQLNPRANATLPLGRVGITIDGLEITLYVFVDTAVWDESWDIYTLPLGELIQKLTGAAGYTISWPLKFDVPFAKY